MASRWHNGRLAELRFRCASNCRAGDDTKALAVTESVPPVLSGCEAISDSQSRAGRRDPTSLAGRREVLDGHLSHDRTRRRHICGRPLLEGRAEQERCTSHEAALVGAREHGRPLAQRSPSGSRGTRSGVTPVLRFDVADAAARHPRGAYYRLEQPRPPAAGPRRRPPRVRPLPRASRRFGDQAQDARIGRSSCVWAARRQTFARSKVVLCERRWARSPTRVHARGSSSKNSEAPPVPPAHRGCERHDGARISRLAFPFTVRDDTQVRILIKPFRACRAPRCRE